MYRHWILLTGVWLSVLACSAIGAGSTQAPAIPAPLLPTIEPARRDSNPVLETSAEEDFSTGIDGWQTSQQGSARSGVAWDPAGLLTWTVDTAPKEAAFLTHPWPALADADGLTIRLTSLDRAVFLVLVVAESDGSAYNLVLPVGKGETVEYSIAYEEFGLDENSLDENGRLDADRLTTLSLMDITGYLEQPVPNRIELDRIALWTGELAPIGPPCADSESANPGTPPVTREMPFRTGVDANFIPLAEQAGKSFRVGDDPVNPLELFAKNGADGFRTRVWVGEAGESKRNYAAAIALRAQQAGLAPYLVLFLSESWADVNGQPAPSDWAKLSIESRADAIRRYAAETTRYFLEQGIRPDFYEIGNEIDYGIAGVFADASQPRDAESLRAGVWPDEARLIRAAIAGVRETDPDARFLLHIAVNWHPDFAAAFFSSMAELGVDYDYVGLSFYPTAFGSPTVVRFCRTLDRLREAIGKPILIAETAYPAEIPTAGPFKSWRRPLAGYPISADGQARWLVDLFAGMRRRGDVIGTYVFSPDFWFNQEIWGPFALFDKEGRARPGLAALQSP